MFHEILYYLLFLFICLVTAILISPIGIACLAVRKDKMKREWGEFPKLKWFGRICTVLGLTGFVLLVTGIIFLASGAYEKQQCKILDEYFFAKEDTGNILKEDGENVYTNGIIINDKKYIAVDAMSLEYGDKNRTEAIANYKNGKTIFRYEHPSGCDMVAYIYGIYCNENDIEKLDQYYRQDEYRYYAYNSDTYFLPEKWNEVYVDDSFFFEIFEGEKKNMEKCTIEEYEGIEDQVGRKKYFSLEQRSKDGMFERKFSVGILKDGNVYIYVINNPFNIKKYENDYSYLVTDSYTKERLINLGKDTPESDF